MEQAIMNFVEKMRKEHGFFEDDLADALENFYFEVDNENDKVLSIVWPDLDYELKFK